VILDSLFDVTCLSEVMREQRWIDRCNVGEALLDDLVRP
jgi:hypothetical protein